MPPIKAPKSGKSAVVVSLDDAEVTSAADEQGVDSFFGDLGLGGEYRVLVERRVESGDNKGKMAYIARRPYTDTLLEDLQREYGGGQFQIRLIAGDGKYVAGGTRSVVIEGPRVDAVAGVTASAAPNEDKEFMRAIVLALVGKQAAPPVSPLDDLAKLTTVLKTLIPKTDSGDVSAKDLMAQYQKGREDEAAMRDLLLSMAGSGSSGDDTTAALLKIGMPLVDLMKSHAEATKQAGGAAPVRAPVAPTQPVPRELDVSPFWVHMLRPYVRDLLPRARAGKNARVYADAVMEDMPEPMIEKVAETVADRDFAAKFITAFPEFGETVALQQWVAEFVDEVREWLRPEEDDEEQAAADAERVQEIADARVANA